MPLVPDMGRFKYGEPVAKNPGTQFTQVKPEAFCTEVPVDIAGSTFGFSPQTSPVKDLPDDGDLSGDDLNRWAGLGDNSLPLPCPSKPITGPLEFANARLVTDSAISQYGQVTPPMDRSPSYPSPKNSTIDAIMSKPPRKQRKTHHNDNDPAVPNVSAVQPQNPPPRRRRTSTRKSSANNGSGSADEKRNKFLERNRVAASKCRQKKKVWTESLEADHRDQQSLRRMLIEQRDSAQQEILYLKNMLLAHADCHHPDLDHWLRNSASNITKNDHEFTDLAEGQSIEGIPADFDPFEASLYESLPTSEPIGQSAESAGSPQPTDPEIALLEQSLVNNLAHGQVPPGDSKS